jgi:hypothetical protein
VVSPWFAAGGGIVVAAGAFIVAPHAQLNFGPAIARSPCTVAKGHHAAPLAGAPPVPAGGGVGPVTPSPTATPEPPNGADLIFKYSVTWHTRDMFQMVLTVTSKKAIRTWQLSFVIPAAADVKVSNADWQPSGTDGGMASSTTVGSGGPVGTHSAAPSAGASVGDSPASDNPDVVSLVVTGNGAPAAPQSCSFDGSACSFSPS